MEMLTNFQISYDFLNLSDAICTESNSGVHYRYLADGTKVEMRGYDDIFFVISWQNPSDVYR